MSTLLRRHRTTIDLIRKAVNPGGAAVVGLWALLPAVMMKRLPMRISRVVPDMRQGMTAASITPDVVGGGELVAKQSAVDTQGALRALPIDGVVFRPTRPVPHEDGHLTEVARATWDILDEPIVQVHITTTLPGRVRAWGLHQGLSDRLFVVDGLVKIAVFDGRNGSPTSGRINEFTVSARNPGLLIIPPNLYHGWKNIGTSEAIIINMPTRMYNYEAPDALDLPWDSEAARRIVPYQW